MSDLTEKSIVPLEFQLQAVTILANIRGEKIKELEASLQQCQGEVEHYKREWKDRTEQLETWIKDHHKLEREATQLRALLAEAREALGDMNEAFDSDTARRMYTQHCAEGWSMLEIGACIKSRSALAKISAAIGDKTT